MIFRQRFVFFLLVSLLPNSLWAESERFFSIQYENDLITPNNQDKYYTNGVQFSLLIKEDPPKLLDMVSKLTPFYQQGDGLNLVKYTLGQKMFTPDDIVNPNLQLNDRPYAGYLYFGASVLSRISHTDNFSYGNQFEITLGVVGSAALGERTQTEVHKMMGSDLPQGWSHQLNNEPALGLSYVRFWRLIQPTSFGLAFGINPQISAAIGNVYTYGSGGVMFRLGSNLRRDMAPPTIRPAFQGVSYFQREKHSDWYVFLGFESRLVARDIFLDGNTFNNSHSVEKELLVGDMQYGFVYMIGDVRIA
ncbi:MAG: lipid A deacylase LpxR family protein, partial [Ghiorsea sp.]|nr:lipid A deacylase LpxR family protein [Ghiorsea sp.]